MDLVRKNKEHAAAFAALVFVSAGLWIWVWLGTFGACVAGTTGAGVYWKLEVANSWLNRCLNLVYEPQVERAFDASLAFFVLGLVCALVLLFVAAWGKPQGEVDASG